MEDGGFDVVALVLLLLLRDVAQPHRLQLFRQEVAPLVFGSVARIWNAESSAPRQLCLIRFSGSCAGDSDRTSLALVQQVCALASLYAGEHSVDRKGAVVGTLIGSVAEDGVHFCPRRFPALCDGLLIKGIVSSSGPFHLNTVLPILDVTSAKNRLNQAFGSSTS